ncbi:MAG: M56 family metallopeptidase [Eubacteriales bacterium]|nr:M56 family metallopeptidase [Eubacteriales bacterium]
MPLLQRSFTSAVLILAIIGLRALALYKLPKKTFTALWGIALLHLLLPVSLPSPFSVYSIFHSEKIVQTARNTAQGRTLQTAVADTISTGKAPVSIWMLIWAAGCLIGILLFAASYWKCYREFRTSLPVNQNTAKTWLAAHKLKRTLSIRQSSRISAPLTYGIFRPVILMPKTTDWSDERIIRYVLTHEYVHIKRFDTLFKFFLALALCIHWFNPLVWVMYTRANRDIELVCDETVVRIFGEEKKASYARALIQLEETRSGFTPMCSHFSKNSMEERITAIMKTKKRTIHSNLVSCALVAGTAILFATSASASGNQQKIDDTAMTETALQRLEETYPAAAAWVRECYPDTVWWTSEAYKQMMDTEREKLEDLLGETIGSTPSSGEIVVTEAMIEEQMTVYEEIYQELEDGWMVSKSMDGNEELGGSFHPADIVSGTGTAELQLGILLNDGTEETFGPYETAEEMLSEVKPFCEEQVKLGNLSPDEAEEIIQKYTAG